MTEQLVVTYHRDIQGGDGKTTGDKPLQHVKRRGQGLELLGQDLLNARDFRGIGTGEVDVLSRLRLGDELIE